MDSKIKISKKPLRKGEDGHKVISVRMKEEIALRLDELSAKTNRSRNELINLLLSAALSEVIVDDSLENSPPGSKDGNSGCNQRRVG